MSGHCLRAERLRPLAGRLRGCRLSKPQHALENSSVTSRPPLMLRDHDFSLKPSVIELALANRSVGPEVEFDKAADGCVTPIAASNHSIRFA